MPDMVGLGSASGRFLTGFAALLAAAAFAATAAASGERAGCSGATAQGGPATAPAAASSAPASRAARSTVATPAGLRAFVDPETGQLREPTREEVEALSRAMLQASALAIEPSVVQYPNGMLGVQLGDEFMNDVVARRNPDGSISMVCVPGSQLEKAMAQPAPAKRPDLEKE